MSGVERKRRINVVDTKLVVEYCSECEHENEFRPDVILNNVSGAENLPVIINYTKLYLAIRGSGVFKGHYHNLGTDIAKQLPDFLSNPDAIIKLDNGRLNMLTTMATEYGVMRLYRLNLIVQRI